jgi:hypothetical protein
MKRRHEKIEVCFLIIISFVALGYSSWFYSWNLPDIDFLSSDLSLENPDHDHPLVNRINGLMISESDGFSDTFLLKSILLERLPLIAFPTSSFTQENVPLRC